MPLPATPSRPCLADRIEDLLPQTQCTKCGYAGCRPYAEAIADGSAQHNRCPPGGAEGIARLAALLGEPVLPLDLERGAEGPRSVALIDEAACIGCTLCIQACPVDAIAGAAKQMHTVLADWCTGCDLCVPPCPVDCIAMVNVSGARTGWDAWSPAQADAARMRHAQWRTRLVREKEENDARLAAKAVQKLRELESETGGDPAALAERARKQAVVRAALERARLRHAAGPDAASPKEKK
ncbi:MAG: electron transport complex subunit RsxB [Burkholderiaceae bacterium]